MAASSTDPYEVLGVAHTVTSSEVAAAYRAAVMANHPDRGGDAEAFRVVQDAFAVLRDPQQRLELDAYIYTWGTGDGFGTERAFRWEDVDVKRPTTVPSAYPKPNPPAVAHSTSTVHQRHNPSPPAKCSSCRPSQPRPSMTNGNAVPSFSPPSAVRPNRRRSRSPGSAT